MSLAAHERFHMFDKIRITDWDSIIYSVMLLVPTIMFSIPIFMLAFYAVKKGLAGVNILRGLHPGDYATIFVCGLIYLLLLAGMRWAWRQPALVSIENNGEWICRNSFFYSLLRIPPDMPRRIEGMFQESKDENSNEVLFYVQMQIVTDLAPPVSMTFMSNRLENGEPDFFQKFGYPANLVILPGPGDIRMTPWHGWNSYGYVYLLDRNAAEAQINSGGKDR